MSLYNTSLFKVKKTKDSEIKETLLEVATILRNKGYNPVHQIVGYITTGDPVYITNEGNARHKIRLLDRNKVIEVLLASYLKWES